MIRECCESAAVAEGYVHVHVYVCMYACCLYVLYVCMYFWFTSRIWNLISYCCKSAAFTYVTLAYIHTSCLHTQTYTVYKDTQTHTHTYIYTRICTCIILTYANIHSVDPMIQSANQLRTAIDLARNDVKEDVLRAMLACARLVESQASKRTFLACMHAYIHT